MAYIPKIRDKWNDKEPVTREQAAYGGKFGNAPYANKAQMESVSQKLRATSLANPSQRNAMDRITGRARNQELKENATAYANAKRNEEFEQKWYKGDKPTTAEYYSAIRKAQGLDKAKANEIALGFINWQNDPNSEYYEPYLHRMTNTAAAQGIYELTGLDISGGITQKEIDELKQYADYSNRGVGGTPIESKNPSQQLAYWLYNLEKDEKTTQQAELEMTWMQEDIQNLVDKGFSDDYIVKHLDMARYPTLNKMQQSASIGAVTPLNRPIGYSNDYVFGAIWAARNGGSSGKTAEDIANWHDKVGNVYTPNKDAEAARDPESDNYHPYSLGATTELESRKEYTGSQLRTAKNNTEDAKEELENLKEFVENSIKSGKTADEIKKMISDNEFKMLEDNYPTLAKMEFARREGAYILLTDTVDFAIPYFEKWIDDKYAEKQAEMDALSKKAFENAITYMDTNFGTNFSESSGGSMNQPADATEEDASENTETEEDKEEALSASVKPDAEAKAPEVKETHVQEETPSETPVTPNPYFDIRQIETDEQAKTELWSALYDYRRGFPVTDENAAAFIQKYPYLFGGEVGWMGSVRNENGELVPLKTTSKNVDTRRTVLKGGMYAGETELGKTGAELLKSADTAQSNGYYSQHDYVNLLMTLATEIENAKANGVSFEEYINTEGTGANALLKDTTQRLTAYKVAQDATRKQEVLDYGAEIHNLRNAYESGNFDNSYIIVGSEEERAIAEADPANEGKYIWTEDEKNKWQQLIEESYDTVVTSGEIGIYDPKKYYTLADGDVYRIVEEELGYIDEYVNIDDYEMYGVKNDVYHLISNRVKNTLLNDLGIAKAAGITVDEYYNSLGYGSSYDRKNWDRNYDDLTDYVTGLVQKEIEAWRNLEIGLTEDLESAIEEMEWHEYYEDDTDTLNFTEDEIQAVLENGDITEEQANMIRLYNDVKDPEGKKRSLEYWQENGGIDAIKTIMYSNLVKLSSDQIRAKQDANESEPERYVGVVGNRKDGKASLGYVVGTGVKLGATEHKKSWIETWYGFAREDSSGLEKEYRTRFSREEVRNNILSTIETISDAELRDALITELDLYDGDIYDFNYDFTVEHIREKIRKTDEKIAYVQEEVAQYCTPEQARMLNTISSGTNTVLFMAENIALTSLAAATGVPIKGAQVIGSALTTGVTSTAETMNTLMDADVSRDSAILAGAVDGMVQVAVEVSLDRFIGIEGKFSPAKSGKNFRTYMAKGIEGEASEGFLRAAMRYGMQLPDLVGGYALDKAKGGIQETAEELIQDVTSTVITNKALELSGKGEYKDSMTWDEVFILLEESVIQSLILDVGSDIITAPAKSAKYALNKRQTQLESARKLAQKEMVNGAQLKRVKEQLEKSMTDGTLEAKMNEAANISAVEERTSEKIIEKTEELKSSPAQGKLQTARGKLEQAQADYDDAKQKEEAAKQAVAVATAPFEQEGHNPTDDETNAYTDAMQELSSAKVTASMAQDDLKKAQAEFDEASAEAEKEISDAITQAADEARQEKVQQIKEEQVRQAQEEYAQAEERVKKTQEQLEREIQETTGATDAEMDKVREKAQKIVEERARSESATKDELVKAFKEKLGKSYNIRLEYDDNAQAGWVTKPGKKKGEIVFNANLDASTLYTTVAAHELSHVAEDSKFAKDVQNSVFEFYYGEDTERMQNDLETLKADYAEDGIQLTDADARLELTAELLQDVFGNNKAWIDSLLAKRPNLAEKMYNWLKEKVTYLKKLVTEGKDVADAYRLFNTVKNNFAKALNDAAVKNGKNAVYEITDEAEQAQDAEAAAIPNDGSVREYALKRRVEAAEKAKAMRNLKNASDAYRQAKDWRNYAKTVEARIKLGMADGTRLNNPVRTLHALAEDFGIKSRIGTNTEAEYFSVYDSKISTLFTDQATASDVAVSMAAIANVLEKSTDISNIMDTEELTGFMISYMTTSDKNLPGSVSSVLPGFMNEVRKMGKEFETALNTARDDLIAYKNATEIGKLNAFMTTRNEFEKKKKLKFGEWLRKNKIALIDATFAAEIVAELTGSHELRQAAAYLPYARRLANRVITGAEFVTLDNVRTGGETMATALNGISVDENVEFQTYLVAKEAIDRYNQDKGPFPEAKDLPSLSDMKKIVSDIENDPEKAHFVTASKKLYAFWRNFMEEYVVKEGFLSEEVWADFIKTHPNYVPFMREGSGSYKMKEAKGKDIKPVYEPIENMISMIEQFTNQAVQNRFARTFDKLYEQNDGLSSIAVRLPYEAETVPANTTIIDRDLDPNRDSDVAEADVPKGFISTKDGDILMINRADGSRVAYKIYDKALFDLLSGKSASTQKAYLNGLGKVTRTMAYLTTGINPQFIIKNFIRDFQKSVNHGTWAKTYFDGFVKWLADFGEVWKAETESYKDFEALGAGEYERLNIYTRGGERRYKEAIFANNKNVFKKASGFLGKLATTVETTSRYAEYKRGKETNRITGETKAYDKSTQEGKIKAFMAAMETTVDFERRGNSAFARTFANVIPFFNATIQGNYQTARLFTDGEKEHLNGRIAKYAVNNVLMGAISGIIHNLFVDDETEEKYRKLLDSYKRNYIILPWFDGAERDFIRLPVAQDWLSKVLYEFGRQLGSGEVKDIDGFGADMLHAATGAVFESITDLSPIYQVILDIPRNRTWAGGNIVSDYAMELPSYQRANDDTSGVFRTLSAGLDVLRRVWNRGWKLDANAGRNGLYATLTTPAALEYAAEQLTGWVGQIVVPLISRNRYSGQWTLTGGIENVLNSMRNSFSIDADSYSVIDETYENAITEINELVTAGKRGTGYRMNPANSEEMNAQAFEEAKAATLKGGVIKNAQEAISNAWDEINAIQTDEGLSASERRIRTEELREEIQRQKDTVNGWYLEFEDKYIARSFWQEIFGGEQDIRPMTDVEKLAPQWKEAYDRGEEYMIRAEETGKFPKPNTSFDKTENHVKTTYTIADYPQELQDAYNNTYNDTWLDAYNMKIATVDYESLTPEQKKDFMSSIHSYAHDEAKKAFWKLYEQYGRPTPNN